MFKVTIEEETTKEETVREYQKLYDVGAAPVSSEADKNYGYVEVTKPVTRSRKVLTQEVDTLDLPAVIKAINGLS